MAQPWELVVIILIRKCQRPGAHLCAHFSKAHSSFSFPFLALKIKIRYNLLNTLYEIYLR